MIIPTTGSRLRKLFSRKVCRKLKPPLCLVCDLLTTICITHHLPASLAMIQMWRRIAHQVWAYIQRSWLTYTWPSLLLASSVVFLTQQWQCSCDQCIAIGEPLGAHMLPACIFCCVQMRAVFS